MTDLTGRALHRLGERLPGRLSMPGDKGYNSSDGDLGEARRPHAARRCPLPVNRGCPGRDSRGPWLRPPVVGTWRRPRLGGPGLVRRTCHRLERHERRNRGSQQQHRTNFRRGARRRCTRGFGSGRACGRDRVGWRGGHDGPHLRRRLWASDRPLSASRSIILSLQRPFSQTDASPPPDPATKRSFFGRSGAVAEASAW
jgi:hypothetical protein